MILTRMRFTVKRILVFYSLLFAGLRMMFLCNSQFSLIFVFGE